LLRRPGTRLVITVAQLTAPHISHRRKRGTPSSFITTRNISSASDRSVSGSKDDAAADEDGALRKF
jgi:hypothetical protein